MILPGSKSRTTIADEGTAFSDHLERASKIVAEWPEWKRNILGGGMTTDNLNKNAVVRRVIFEALSQREQVFLLNARNIATLSHDKDTVHSLIPVKDNNIVATGYNGFPAGADDANLPTTRPAKYPYIVHAEINAICNAARRGVSIEGATAYCTGECCLDCFKALLQCGVRNFVVGNRGHTRKDDHEKYLRYFSDWYECSITHVIDFPEDKPALRDMHKWGCDELSEETKRAIFWGDPPKVQEFHTVVDTAVGKVDVDDSIRM